MSCHRTGAKGSTGILRLLVAVGLTGVAVLSLGCAPPAPSTPSMPTVSPTPAPDFAVPAADTGVAQSAPSPPAVAVAVASPAAPAVAWPPASPATLSAAGAYYPGMNHHRNTGAFGGPPEPAQDNGPVVSCPNVPRIRLPNPPRRRPVPAVRLAAAPGQPADREGYQLAPENGYRIAATAPRSTFRADVATASYTYVRTMLNLGGLPADDSVHSEEFLNAFPYDYPEPAGEHPLAVYTEYAVAPYNPKRRLVHIGLQTRRSDTASLPASNLVFLIDVNGSNKLPERLPLLKQAFKLFAAQLRPQDRVSVAVYNQAQGLVLPPTAGTQQSRIIAALDHLPAGGPTAGGEGIELALSLARQGFVPGGNNRVILVASDDRILGAAGGEALVEEARKSGIFLTILALGLGRYPDATQQLLDHKDTHTVAFADDVNEARAVLVFLFGGTLGIVAKAVNVQVDFDPARVKGYQLLGFETNRLAAERFKVAPKENPDLGAGHSVTALYEIIPADSDEAVPDGRPLDAPQVAPTPAAASDGLLTVTLRYQQPHDHGHKVLSHTLLDTPVDFAEASETFRFSAAVATFARLLKYSRFLGDNGFGQVQAWAEGARGHDVGGHRAEFVSMVERAAELQSPGPPYSAFVQRIR